MFSAQPITTYAELEEELQASEVPYDLEQIAKAYALAAQAHQGGMRKSGGTVLSHALTTAVFLVRLRLDTDSIVAGLLHELPEVLPDAVNRIDKDFSADAAFIVAGMQDIKSTTATFQAHNEDPTSFRYLILRSVDDIRVLIVRLANKLHDALTLQGLEPEKQLAQAHKIELVYAPLCEYLGLGSFLEVFEGIAFSVLQPREHAIVQAYINNLEEENVDFLGQLSGELEEILQHYGIENYRISARAKNPLSAYRKVLRKHLLPGQELQPSHVAQLRDLLGVRVIVQDIAECYMLLGALHSKHTYDEKEFDDYVVRPKESGYRSIHTVIDYLGKYVEVQIRTAEMHEFNEFGPASHIAYKLLKKKGQAAKIDWAQDLTQWRENSEASADKYKIKAFADSIFVFTPKGRVLQLANGSKPLDFAYKIHGDLGDRYQGALVNGKMRALDTKLETGDVVEIIIGKKVNVSNDWLKFCTMTATKNKVRKALRNLAQRSS